MLEFCLSSKTFKFLLKKLYYILTEKSSTFSISFFILNIRDVLAKQKFGNEIIKSVIEKNKKRRQISQLTIKIDSKLDDALSKLSNSLNISKNRLIEDILFESGIIKEVEENYHD